MKVYRYESQIDSFGPYTTSCMLFKGSTFCKKLMESHNKSAIHRGARSDIIDFKSPYDRVACESIEQLKKWFYGFNRGLLKYNFSIVEYTVEKIKKSESGNQCAFDARFVVERKYIQKNF